MRILVVGSRILPFRHAGDKNFWLDMFPRLQRLGHELDVVSMMVDDVPSEGMPIHRVPPIPVYLRPDLRFNASYWHIAGTNNFASKTLSFPRILREVRRRVREFRPDVVHFIENYGPVMFGLRPLFPGVPLSLSAPTYQPTRPLYDLLLKTSFASFDTIVPFSEAYRQRLLDLGLSPRRVRRIRWGVDTDRFAPLPEAQREAAREKLGIRRDQTVSFWTGFIQQTSDEDLQASLRIAEQTLRKEPEKHAFLFCFKPEHFKESYRAYERPGLRIFGTGDAFQAARMCADLLLSPIQIARSTAAPPLAWLESLAMGTPILTTNIPGAAEAVVDGRSGFTVRSPEEATERLLEIGSDPELRRRLQEGARQVAVESYSVDRALAEYLDLWSTLAHGSNGGAHPRGSINASHAS